MYLKKSKLSRSIIHRALVFSDFSTVKCNKKNASLLHFLSIAMDSYDYEIWEIQEINNAKKNRIVLIVVLVWNESHKVD